MQVKLETAPKRLSSIFAQQSANNQKRYSFKFLFTKLDDFFCARNEYNPRNKGGDHEHTCDNPFSPNWTSTKVYITLFKFYQISQLNHSYKK